MNHLASKAQANNRIHTELKIPPNSVEAEQAVLGAILIDDSAWDKISGILTESDFYRADHRMIFKTLAYLADSNKPFDIVTMSEYLEQKGELDRAGGLPYLGTLAKDTPSSANIKAYAEIVRERSMLRQVISIGSEMVGEAFNPANKASELVDIAQTNLMNIHDAHRVGEPVHSRIVLSETIDVIDERFNNGNVMTGLATGYTDVDQRLYGLQKSDLIIIAGRPSMGKTSIVMNFVEHIVIRLAKPVLVFSLEMSRQQLMERMLSSVGHIPLKDIRTGKIEDHQWKNITAATSLLSRAPLYIDDTPALSLAQIRARARRMKRDHGLELIVIDYLQLVRSSVRQRENRVEEVSEISRGLKAMAKEFNVPLIALSQLNRSLESRPNKRPVMSDLRESGALEQDADIICFMYRDVVYNKDTEYPNVAEIITAKFRNGETGTDYLHADLHMVKFQNHIGELPGMREMPPQRHDPRQGLD